MCSLERSCVRLLYHLASLYLIGTRTILYFPYYHFSLALELSHPWVPSIPSQIKAQLVACQADARSKQDRLL